MQNRVVRPACLYDAEALARIEDLFVENKKEVPAKDLRKYQKDLRSDTKTTNQSLYDKTGKPPLWDWGCWYIVVTWIKWTQSDWYTKYSPYMKDGKFVLIGWNRRKYKSMTELFSGRKLRDWETASEAVEHLYGRTREESTVKQPMAGMYEEKC